MIAFFDELQCRCRRYDTTTTTNDSWYGGTGSTTTAVIVLTNGCPVHTYPNRGPRCDYEYNELDPDLVDRDRRRGIEGTRESARRMALSHEWQTPHLMAGTAATPHAGRPVHTMRPHACPRAT